MNVQRIVRSVATLPLRCAEKDLKYGGLKNEGVEERPTNITYRNVFKESV